MPFAIFTDAPEYELRKRTPFRPPNVTVLDIRSAIPKHLYEKSTLKGLCYLFRDIICALILFSLAARINTTFLPLIGSMTSLLIKFCLWSAVYIAWGLYFYFQSLVFAGFWCLGHEAGHGNLSNLAWLNTVIGFTLHTFLLIPYFAWRSTHNAHHKATMSLERDENYVPRARSDYNLPPQEKAQPADYEEIFEDVPLYILGRIILMQLLGMQIYLLRNSMGSPMYAPGANHFSPSSPLFKPHERRGIIISDIALCFMAFLISIHLKHFGFSTVFKFYIVPYLLANHWIVMLTYLHHSDPTIPHYRNKEWTFLRGALATVDRPFLGWIGRYILHNVSHDHVLHHCISSIPFYNAPQATQILKSILGNDYNYDSTNSFRALYRTFTECCFIEDGGDIVFYKNRHGQATRVVATESDSDTNKDTFEVQRCS